MHTIPCDLVIDAHCQLGEGPLWSAREQTLYWVDIEAKRVHRYVRGTGHTDSVTLPAMPGVVVERAAGGLAIADEQGFAGLDFATGALTRWANPEAARPSNRFNDGKVDPQGRFWAGTMQAKESDPGAQGAGSLWCLGPDHRASKLLGGLTIANGLAWAASGDRFYYIDTPTKQIASYRYDPAVPALRERTVAVEIDQGRDGWPDGMCIDDEGMLWCAHWGGWAVNRWDPATGRKLATIKVPSGATTSCCFGGAKRDELWITSSARGVEGDPAKQPHAGGVFVARPGVTGPASMLFRG